MVHVYVQEKTVSFYYPNVTTLVTFVSLLLQTHLSVVCLSVVCLSVTLVHPTQGVEAFGEVSSPLCTLCSNFIRAVSNGAIFSYPGWPLATHTTPFSTTALQIWRVGLSLHAQACWWQTAPERGVVRATWSTLEFYTEWNIFRMPEATELKFCAPFDHEKY